MEASASYSELESVRTLKSDVSKFQSFETDDSDFEHEEFILPNISEETLNFETTVVKAEPPQDHLLQCTEHGQNLQDAVVNCLGRLGYIDNEILTKKIYLNEKLDIAVKKEEEDKKTTKFYKPINLFATPYFRDLRKSSPSTNEDSIMKKLHNDIDAYTGPARPWTSAERKHLRDAVIENARELEMKPLLFRKAFCIDKLQKGTYDDEEKKSLEKRIFQIEDELEIVRNLTPEQLMIEVKPLDWLKISASLSYVNRSHEDCEQMWRNYLHPSINRMPWTAEEDEELSKVASKHNGRLWTVIASELTLSKRTPLQCFERYQSHINPSMVKSAWTLEEDRELKRVVEANAVGTYIPWTKVGQFLPGRSNLQLCNRYKRSVAPTLKRGSWNDDEDAVLIAAVEKYGNQWAKVAELLPGRSNFAVRERLGEFVTIFMVSPG